MRLQDYKLSPIEMSSEDLTSLVTAIQASRLVAKTKPKKAAAKPGKIHIWAYTQPPLDQGEKGTEIAYCKKHRPEGTRKVRIRKIERVTKKDIEEFCKACIKAAKKEGGATWVQLAGLLSPAR